MPTTFRSLIGITRDICDWWVTTLSRIGRQGTSGLRQDVPARIDTMVEYGDFCIDVSSRSAVLNGPYLKLQYATQALPFSRAYAVALALVREKTPFSTEDVHVVPEIADDRSEAPSFYVLKRQSIDRDLNAAAADKISIDRLGVNDGGQIRWLPSRGLEELHPVFRRVRRRRVGLLIAVLVLSAVGCATYVRNFLKYDAAEQQLSELIEVRRTEAQKVRKLLDLQQKSMIAVEAARQGKRQSIPLVRVWEELTRLLPDDVWITDIAIDERSMRITGFASQSAASLIAVLAESPYFSDPRFVSPVVRIPGQPGERFEIQLELEAV